MDTLKEAFVKAFLKKVKGAIKKGGFVYKANRPENIMTTSKLDFKNQVEEVKAEIMKLEYNECYAGPESDDKSRPGEIFKFLKIIDNLEVYIKLCLTKDEDGVDKVICISFHESKYERG